MKKFLFAALVVLLSSVLYVSCTPPELVEDEQTSKQSIEKEEIEEDDI